MVVVLFASFRFSFGKSPHTNPQRSLHETVGKHLNEMQYYLFIIDDSGAIEEIDYKKIDGKIVAICKMYDDIDFNKLNDILHSTNEYIINEKALNIFKESNTIDYKLGKAKVLRKEKLFGLFTSESNATTVKITVKFTAQDVNEILQSFRRYEYVVISNHEEDYYIEDLKERSKYLQKYLNI